MDQTWSNITPPPLSLGTNKPLPSLVTDEYLQCIKSWNPFKLPNGLGFSSVVSGWRKIWTPIVSFSRTRTTNHRWIKVASENQNWKVTFNSSGSIPFLMDFWRSSPFYLIFPPLIFISMKALRFALHLNFLESNNLSFQHPFHSNDSHNVIVTYMRPTFSVLSCRMYVTNNVKQNYPTFPAVMVKLVFSSGGIYFPTLCEWIALSLLLIIEKSGMVRQLRVELRLVIERSTFDSRHCRLLLIWLRRAIHPSQILAEREKKGGSLCICAPSMQSKVPALPFADRSQYQGLLGTACPIYWPLSRKRGQYIGLGRGLSTVATVVYAKEKITLSALKDKPWIFISNEMNFIDMTLLAATKKLFL